MKEFGIVFLSLLFYEVQAQTKMDSFTNALQITNSFNAEDTSANTAEQRKIVADFKVFPNPANNFISFSGFSDEHNIHYVISTMFGQTAMENDRNSRHNPRHNRPVV